MLEEKEELLRLSEERATSLSQELSNSAKNSLAEHEHLNRKQQELLVTLQQKDGDIEMLREQLEEHKGEAKIEREKMEARLALLEDERKAIETQLSESAQTGRAEVEELQKAIENKLAIFILFIYFFYCVK
jgi:septal ring factor EnvC (AmiA/AmiB activator)